MPIVCLYSGGEPFKRGTYMRSLGDGISQEEGWTVCYNDETIEPDIYVFEKTVVKTRYKKPIIIRAENLIGEDTKELQSVDNGDAIVFNSEWLRWVYFNTYQRELKNVRIIPPPGTWPEGQRNAPDVKEEQHIVCISK